MIDEYADANTVTYEIHPSIGIARLGSSDSYFIGPEPIKGANDEWVTRRPFEDETPAEVSGPFMYRDSAGELKRQAARFRIYKCTRDSHGVLTDAEEVRYGDEQVQSVDWTVHLRNRKGAAARFEQSAEPGRPTSDIELRNSGCADRDTLVVDPEPRTLHVPPGGAGQNTARFDTGVFLGQSVPLGEIRTDATGRLLVLGGRGKSITTSVPPSLPSFADNDGWCDDTSDGPVSARVMTKDGVSIDVVPSWVIVAPPDFAPDVSSFVTLYDVCLQVWMDKQGVDLSEEVETNFYRDVLPILRRARGYRWVFSGVMRSEVPDKHGSWSDESSALFAALAEPSDIAPPPGSVSEKAIRYRQMLFAHLRDPDDALMEPREVAMPRLHDDFKKLAKPGGASQVLALTRRQYRHMRNWANGTFKNTQLPVTERERECDALDRIALQACSGGPFFPGMEAPRIMKDKRLYMAPCRIDPHSELWSGDLNRGAGRITEGLAVPWQSDFYECRMDGDATWWPATHPDKVVVLRDDKKMDLPADALSEQMELWHFGIKDAMDMVNRWSSLGVVKAKRLTVEDGWSIPATADDVGKNDKNELVAGTVYVEEERIESPYDIPPHTEPPGKTLRRRPGTLRTVRAQDNRDDTLPPGSP
ncbi:LodA/GoxA family CTQ-dependent oxidase [Paraburkholderia rhizosphaerae]|uniref:L-lysine 6-oxidase n=1 Tax=Paraburkholderia rhizosphaerae TaxID=480658 RepID=A0A4R8LC64_9BURK|nr:LodA/GoxA family CTQ-dependent oxidase [Paraburkholderia rhizosphaerae]TDY40552.1 hypothetical protein BX592_12465 [Paraburkholderia rhizosphaerae]